MKGYIYKIINKENNRFYIGSTIEPEKRQKRHFDDLKNKKHHCLFLQRACDKYGIDNFEFIPKEVNVTNEKELRILEERYISYCWNSGKLYNTSKKASGGDLISYHPKNKEFRELQSKLVRERYSKLSEEEKHLLSEKMMGDKNPNYGHKWTKELRDKASKYWKNYYLTHESYIKGKTFEEVFGEEKAKEKRKRLSESASKRIGEKNPFFNKSHTDEAKKKMRNARLGKKPANSKKVFYNETLYDSANDCAKKLGIPMVTVAYRCRNEIYGFKYIENNVDKSEKSDK